MYVLDSNTFIDAKNRYYGFDIVPSFWNELISRSRGNILTIDHIKNEIMSGNDELSTWFNTHYLTFTEATNDDARPKPKDHGKGRQIEGCFSKDDKIVLIDDLITTGGSVLNAVITFFHSAKPEISSGWPVNISS